MRVLHASSVGGTDGSGYKGSIAHINGNHNVLILDENDSRRKLNLNWYDNDWNANYLFLGVRYFGYFSPFS